jgi:hypothetical protein
VCAEAFRPTRCARSYIWPCLPSGQFACCWFLCSSCPVPIQYRGNLMSSLLARNQQPLLQLIMIMSGVCSQKAGYPKAIGWSVRCYCGIHISVKPRHECCLGPVKPEHPSHLQPLTDPSGTGARHPTLMAARNIWRGSSYGCKRGVDHAARKFRNIIFESLPFACLLKQYNIYQYSYMPNRSKNQSPSAGTLVGIGEGWPSAIGAFISVSFPVDSQSAKS